MKSAIIRLDEARCHNCMKCVRACPTGAMTYNGSRPEIVDEDCILCGRCYVTCPRGAQRVVSDFSRLEGWLSSGEETVLSVDPAFAAVWPDYQALHDVLIARGFAYVEETARAAAEVSAAYAQLIQEGTMKNIISSACPVVNTLIETVYPELLDQLAPVASPAIVHGRQLRKKFPQAKIVYLTPCVAASREIREERFAGLFDACIGMEELAAWIRKDYKGVEACHWGAFEGSIARMYPSCGGITATLEPTRRYRFVAADGIGRIRMLMESLKRGELSGCFIEVTACRGSCMTGPLLSHYTHNEWLGHKRIMDHSDPSRIPARITPEEETKTVWKDRRREQKVFTKEQIDEEMIRLGKTSIDKILDCGACGYDTCRQKAAAVLAGRADPRVCLPAALSRISSISNMIIDSTPNGIIVFGEDDCVVDLNDAAKKMLRKEKEDVAGVPVEELLPDSELAAAVRAHTIRRTVLRSSYECYHKLFDQVVMHIEDHPVCVVILMDRTDEDARIRAMNDMRERTMQVTQDVIDAQMRSVQEIASLLGETTAKSKIALLKLQRVMDEEQKND